MEILFDNPFIIIILIAALSSMFKNKKKPENDRKRGTSHTSASKPERPSNRMDEMKEIFKEVTRHLSEEHPVPAKKTEEMYQEKQDEAAQLIETLKQKSDVKGKIESITTGISQGPDKQTMGTEKKDNSMKLDESTLIDAVVWSEILGPPRAKNPYRKRRA